MLRVYGMSASGNCYKVKLLLHHLGVPYDWRETDITRGASRTPEYLAMNPNGKVPLLEVAPGRYLAESNAILCYLAEGTDYLAGDRWDRGQVLQWLFFEQYSHEPYIATSRFILNFMADPGERLAELPEKHRRGHAALEVMESHLAANDFFAGGHYSIADIALYAYTHVAPEGGFDMTAYSAINRWLLRVADQPGHVPMTA